ncbi:hypothetical protein THAOC_31635 [Thalassiosira oceanica]|uniref:mRNA capping enzyme adenylation domain-containing protein n=1 Tax=Thalassiosira oceanica TaxID=159749 RepID=K0RKR0_THAOC|nr:hypothetical protein THAOC_31635 [Thalassiosira oceanica]|eukprot:EJK49486.1 hypothetical protein THAOC_31635 [Thalassiosira oceanica]
MNYAPRPPLLPWTTSTWERWAKQGRLSSTPVPRTPFLLLKGPASSLYEQKYAERDMFTVSMYCSRMMAKSMRIGLVVDCTALDIEDFEPLPSSRSSASSQFDKRTKYWHNQNEWDEFDIEFQRLSPPRDSKCGGDDPLAPKMLTEFHKIVSMFLQKNRGRASSTYIAIFDSRGGLGAASYLAAAYMCKSLKAPVHVAIAAVREATPLQPDPKDAILAKRKWGICDVRLIKDLQVRFKGRKEIILDGKVPRWWWALGPDEDADDESDEGGHEANAEGEHGDGKKRTRDEESITIPPCADDDVRPAAAKKARNGDDAAAAAPYPQLPSQILEPLQRGSSRWTRAAMVVGQLTQTEPLSSISSVLKPDESSEDLSDFQPIKSDPNLFHVTWASTRSRRGLLLILSEAVYFLEQQQDESIEISYVTNIKFPRADLTKRQHRTLIDVVLVKDIDQGASVFRFYALDLLFIDGGTVHHKPLHQRLRYLKDRVLIPRKKDEARGGEGHIYAKEPIKIRSKDYFQISKLGFVLRDVCSGVSHEANGIKFVPTGEYGLGKEKGMLAPTLTWKKGGRVPDDKLINFLS